MGKIVKIWAKSPINWAKHGISSIIELEDIGKGENYVN